MVDIYIRGGTLVGYPLHFLQHAYHTGRSVETALHSPVYKVRKALMDVALALGAFVYNECALVDITFESICRQSKDMGWSLI
jgi:hypothetical protein